MGFIINPKLVRDFDMSSEFLEMEVTLYQAPLRRIFDWHNRPLINDEIFGSEAHRSQEIANEEAAFIDDINKQLLACPTFKAMVATTNGITDIPLYLECDHEDNYGLYSSYSKTAFVRHHQWGEDEPDGNWRVPISAHEYRHAWHHARGILDRGNGLNVLEEIALNLAYEADAVVAQTTIAFERYDVCGDRSAVDALLGLGSYAVSAKAFLNEYDRRKKSLWDGKAQAAAFKSYLSEDNDRLIRSYAENACEFARRSDLQILLSYSQRDADSLEQKLSRLFALPYKDLKTGALIERPVYNHLRNEVFADTILAHLPKDIRVRAEQIQMGRDRFNDIEVVDEITLGDIIVDVEFEDDDHGDVLLDEDFDSVRLPLPSLSL